MNNTFNYSFLVDKKSDEINQHRSFIPSDIIAEKYTSKGKSDKPNRISVKTRSSKIEK